MNDPTPAQNRTESDECAESGLPAVQGAREALVERLAEAIVPHTSERHPDLDKPGGCWCHESLPSGDWSTHLARAVLPLVDAEVAAAVSEAQAEVTKWRLFAHGETIRADAAEDWQNEIAERIPDSYDCDDAQEAIIARWLDDLTSGDPERVAQATAEGEGL